MSTKKKDESRSLEAVEAQPLVGFAAISAEVAEAGVWKDLATKARALEESLREQIRRRDMLIETADIRASRALNELHDRQRERVRELERERDEARAAEKKAVDELEALKEHTRGLLASLGSVETAVAKKGAAKAKKGEG